jgi:hypothetical protein
MRAREAIAASVASGVLGLGAILVSVAPAHAQDRPVDVAFVRAAHENVLNRDGSVAATAWLRCVPGWVSSDLTMQISQADAYVDGVTTTSLACDNHWHKVRLTLGPGFGTLHKGAVHISSQFLVNNADSGDSAAGHEQVDGHLHRACHH